MNKALIIITVVILNSCIEQKNVYYKSAYSYLVDLPEFKKNGLTVSDTIVHLNLSIFFEELSKGDTKAMFLKLDSLDKSNSFNNYIIPELNSLPSDTSSKYTLFFSKIIDNFLEAEIVQSNGQKGAGHERMTAFNKSRVFLFIFDKQKQISKVFYKEVQYD